MGQLEDQARRIIDENQFMTLATADADGTPWVSPVWFAHVGHRDLIWVSRLQRRHTRNVIDRPEVSLVIFDSTQTPGDVEAVYATGRAEQTDDPALLEAFSARATSQGLDGWTLDGVSGDSGFRLFHVLTDRTWVLDDHDDRLPIEL
jgi:predicted pyridoxine 5'-phosphate oxidase superfamily flavin-nucleotide-binding protein